VSEKKLTEGTEATLAKAIDEFTSSFAE
jgi:hypothetical protein